MLVWNNSTRQFIEFGFCVMWIKKHADLPTPMGTICLNHENILEIRIKQNYNDWKHQIFKSFC